MIIGLLTYYRVANFGANLQAVSTYRYLERLGHSPIMIHYMSPASFKRNDARRDVDSQVDMHLSFVDAVLKNQTDICFTAEDVNAQIEKHGIEAVIVGADAVLQHHPLMTRIKLRGRRRIKISVLKMREDCLFPNPFWGIGIDEKVKIALMSVSSQNSRFRLFAPLTIFRMNKALKRYCFRTVRDEWTKKMMRTIGFKDVAITPDPVFAFNQNAGDLVLTKDAILEKFKLPDNYVLVSFLNYPLPYERICELKALFSEDGMTCVALPVSEGICFEHNYDYAIPVPLSPVDWYALIKYSKGYIGNNMYPIITALHNNVPCFSIDNWLNYDIHNRPINDKSSKIYDVLKRFELEDYYMTPEQGRTEYSAQYIHDRIVRFPFGKVKEKTRCRWGEYQTMMNNLLKALA